MYEHVVMWWTMFTDRLRKESDGMATAELLGNAALGVAALVAILTRCSCSVMDNCPSANAASRIWQVSLRSLSLARVLVV